MSIIINLIIRVLGKTVVNTIINVVIGFLVMFMLELIVHNKYVKQLIAWIIENISSLFENDDDQTENNKLLLLEYKPLFNREDYAFYLDNLYNGFDSQMYDDYNYQLAYNDYNFMADCMCKYNCLQSELKIKEKNIACNNTNEHKAVINITVDNTNNTIDNNSAIENYIANYNKQFNENIVINRIDNDKELINECINNYGDIKTDISDYMSRIKNTYHYSIRKYYDEDYICNCNDIKVINNIIDMITNYNEYSKEKVIAIHDEILSLSNNELMEYYYDKLAIKQCIVKFGYTCIDITELDKIDAHNQFIIDDQNKSNDIVSCVNNDSDINVINDNDFIPNKEFEIDVKLSIDILRFFKTLEYNIFFKIEKSKLYLYGYLNDKNMNYKISYDIYNEKKIECMGYIEKINIKQVIKKLSLPYNTFEYNPIVKKQVYQIKESLKSFDKNIYDFMCQVDDKKLYLYNGTKINTLNIYSKYSFPNIVMKYIPDTDIKVFENYIYYSLPYYCEIIITWDKKHYRQININSLTDIRELKDTINYFYINSQELKQLNNQLKVCYVNSNKNDLPFRVRIHNDYMRINTYFDTLVDVEMSNKIEIENYCDNEIDLFLNYALFKNLLKKIKKHTGQIKISFEKNEYKENNYKLIFSDNDEIDELFMTMNYNTCVKDIRKDSNFYSTAA